MTNAALTWIEKELGILKTEAIAIEPEILLWAKNFLTSVTPVIKQAATDAVLTAMAIPGTGEMKAAAAIAAATADLAKQGVPVVENDLKAAIQIAYNAVPKNTVADAVVAKVDKEIDATGASVAAEVTQ